MTLLTSVLRDSAMLRSDGWGRDLQICHRARDPRLYMAFSFRQAMALMIVSEGGPYADGRAPTQLYLKDRRGNRQTHDRFG